MSPASPVRGVTLAGVPWTVREVHRTVVAGEPDRLLVFDSADEQRWLTPVPPDWLSWNEVQLQDACLRAVTAQQQGVPFLG